MFLLEIEGLARDGWDDKQIAERYHITPQYFCQLKDKYVELFESLKRGRAPLTVNVENSLYKRAVGLEVKTIIKKVTPDGEEILQETITQLPPDTGACMAWLKNKKPELWNRQPVKIEQTNIDWSELIVLPDVPGDKNE